MIDELKKEVKKREQTKNLNKGKAKMRDFLTKKPTSMGKTIKVNKNVEIAQQLKTDLLKHLNKPSKAQKFKTL